MSWENEVEEIRRRKALAQKMGGQEGVDRQHSREKLTVRERIELFADPGSLEEHMGLMGTATYEGDELTGFLPKPSVEGMCKLDGRKVLFSAGDFTVRGGSAGSRGGLGMEMATNERALEWRLPYVRLLDAAGGSVRSFEEIGRTYLPDGNVWTQIDVALLSRVPVVAGVMGSVAGLPAINACLAHFNIMVKGKTQLFPGGPPVVKAAFGEDITKEELGGDHIHVGVSGVVDNLAETEEDAFDQIRKFLSYMPASVYEMPPRSACTDDPERREEKLLKVIPRSRRQVYDSHKVLNYILDKDSFFEIAPKYGRARITGLGRLNGYPVAIIANNPMHAGGTTDVAAGSKSMRIIQLADTFHLPLISFADEPGFMVGLESEKMGIERAGARLVATVCESRIPMCTVVTGRLYGVAGQTHHRPSGMFRRYAWPSAHWGSMPIAGGAAAAYKREVEAADDPEAKLTEIEARLEALASPFRTAEATGQDIIDPRETRAKLCEFVEEAQGVLKGQLGPPLIPYRP
jgi:acetyl-CoA carboxylase carboxyltransferase component